MTLLLADNLSFSYGAAEVLKGVVLRLAAGEVVALLGPNGSGKSTLLRCLLGQLAAQGLVRWGDRPLNGYSPRQLARTVAYLPQAPTWEPTQAVRQALAMGRSPYWGSFGIESAEDLAVVESVARDLHLVDLLDRSMDSLSGGQRQRVLLGRCLVQQPHALLLDEPNTYLDLQHQVELAKRLRGLATDAKLGVLMASHDLNLAGSFADRLILLHNGRVVADGPPDVVLEPALLEAVYEIPMDRVERPGQTSVVVPRW